MAVCASPQLVFNYSGGYYPDSTFDFLSRSTIGNMGPVTNTTARNLISGLSREDIGFAASICDVLYIFVLLGVLHYFNKYIKDLALKQLSSVLDKEEYNPKAKGQKGQKKVRQEYHSISEYSVVVYDLPNCDGQPLGEFFEHHFGPVIDVVMCVFNFVQFTQ